ncbi:MAG TPA: M56 family metallopeptidase [Candidatus Acidoferrales bacterium]|nr:M56 family metallopeptidase [Candidatus Acidoferrales bacterium]
MSPLTWLTEIAWKGTFVMAGAFAAAYALRRGPAAVRHFVWTTALTVLLLLPVALSIGPRWSAAVPAPEPEPGIVQSAETAVVVRATRTPAAPRIPYGFLYAAGALLVVARFAVGVARTRKLVRVAIPAVHAASLVDELRRLLKVGREVRAVQTAETEVPMAWGILHPVIVLPDSAHQWPASRLHAVLLHELVHVRRNDLLAQTLAQAACCLYWFHPLVWLAARQLRKEREAACDDAVLNRGLNPADYAGHLMEMARSMAARQASLVDAPAMAETSGLESRVRSLLDRGRNRAPLSRRAAFTVAALACALVLPVATVTTHAQAGRGALAGVVSDPSGARVPGCTVTAKNLDGSNQETTRVNPAGEYVFTAIPPGRYAIEVRAPGFKISKAEGVVTAGAAARADVALQLGELSESVKVTGTGVPRPPAISQSAGTPQRIPIGGNVKMSRLIQQTKPVYPADLKQQGVTGRVIIKAVLSKEGSLLNPQVVNTDVHPGLAQAALDAVSQWRYEPTLLNGQPVEVITTIEVAFELDQ